MNIDTLELEYEKLSMNIPNEDDYILYVYDFMSLKAMIECFYSKIKKVDERSKVKHLKSDITNLYYKICRITDNIHKEVELIHQDFIPYYAKLEYGIDSNEDIEVMTNRYIIEFSYKKVNYNNVDFYYIDRHSNIVSQEK